MRPFVIGAPPNIGYISVTSLPYGVDEFAVAGGIAGEPVEMVKCKTIDLEVPAHAEIVIEGEVAHRLAGRISLLRRIHRLHVQRRAQHQLSDAGDMHFSSAPTHL